MSAEKKIFIEKSKIAFDLKHRKTISYNISKHEESIKQGRLRYLDQEKAKQRASFIKDKAIANLSDYLLEFEKNAIKNGIQVIWAENSKEAISEILKIIQENSAKLVVKSKSMISEEINLNENIEKLGVKPLETDLGEFIVQIAGEKPYHILTPAMHKSKEDVATLFAEKFNLPENLTPREVTLFVRKLLRQQFVTADIGITGANFLVADTGSVCLTENEGNGMMTVSFPKVHIAVSGIEKILPSFSDLHLFTPLLSACGTGQQVSAYNSIISGPKKNSEDYGPEKMYVVLLDNNRTSLFNQEKISASLKCLRCGACLNACPVYRNVGGYTFHTTYTGPIGSVISPHMNGLKKFGHLSFACTLCGACAAVCPVKIPLPQLLLLNRQKYVEAKFEKTTWRIGMKWYGKIFMNRKYINHLNSKLINRFIPKNILGDQKEFPLICRKTNML